MFLRHLSSVRIFSTSVAENAAESDLRPHSCIGGRTFPSHRFHHNHPLVLQCQAVGTVISNQMKSETKSDDPIIFHHCRKGDLEAVSDELQKGFDLRERDGQSWTCLHWATELGHAKLVVYLLDTEPLLLNMKTTEGLSAINIAAWRGDREMVELLLAQGAEIDDERGGANRLFTTRQLSGMRLCVKFCCVPVQTRFVMTNCEGHRIA